MIWRIPNLSPTINSIAAATIKRKIIRFSDNDCFIVLNAYKNLAAQRLALAAWWEDQLTKRKNAFAATAVFSRRVPPSPPARIVGQSGFCRLLRRKPGNKEWRFLFVFFIRLAEAQFKL